MQQHGMVLLTTLLFVFILTALLLGSIESDLLESKLALHFQENAVAFQAAEAGLAAGAAAIRGEHMKLPATKANINYQEKLLSITTCGKKRYKITATAHYHSISVPLFAFYDWLRNTNRAACKNQVGGRRLYWGAIN